MVPYFVRKADCQRQLGRFRVLCQGKLHSAQFGVLANGDGLSWQRARGPSNVPNGLGIRDCSLRSIIDLDRNAQHLIVGKDEARELGQRDDGRAELRPILGSDITFFAPMHIQRPYERRTLSAVVIQPKQLEAAVVLGAQVALDVVLVA